MSHYGGFFVGTLHVFRLPGLYVGCVHAFQVLNSRWLQVPSVAQNFVKPDFRLLLRDNFTSDKEATERFAIEAGSLWPIDKGWCGHQVSIISTDDISEELAVGTTLFAVAAHAVQVVPGPQPIVRPRSAVFITASPNEVSARSQGLAMIAAEFPQAEGWRHHNAVAQSLTDKHVLKALSNHLSIH